MFSGIVEAIGTILLLTEEMGHKHFCIASQQMLDELKIGDSISVNGVCLTIVSGSYDYFCVTAVAQTLQLTNLNYLKENQCVNLERSIKPTTRIGGHFMQGHIDTVTKILAINHLDNGDMTLTIALPETLNNYVVNKGFIGVDGMSLTITEVNETNFTVTIIPHTKEVTIVKDYQVDDWVNLEVDVMGKYIEKILKRETYVAS